MNLPGAPASRRPVGSRKPEHAGGTPALPVSVPQFRVSKREKAFGESHPDALPSRRGSGEEIYFVGRFSGVGASTRPPAHQRRADGLNPVGIFSVFEFVSIREIRVGTLRLRVFALKKSRFFTISGQFEGFPGTFPPFPPDSPLSRIVFPRSRLICPRSRSNCPHSRSAPPFPAWSAPAPGRISPVPGSSAAAPGQSAPVPARFSPLPAKFRPVPVRPPPFPHRLPPLPFRLPRFPHRRKASPDARRPPPRHFPSARPRSELDLLKLHARPVAAKIVSLRHGTARH